MRASGYSCDVLVPGLVNENRCALARRSTGGGSGAVVNSDILATSMPTGPKYTARPSSSSDTGHHRDSLPDRRLSVLVVAANASTRWAGEAILPLHIFRGLLRAGHEAWLCIGDETRPELEELLGPDAKRVFYVEDTLMHSAFRRIQAQLPLSIGSNPLYYPQVLVTLWRQRNTVARLVARLGIDVVHQPTPVSPRVPSLLVNLPA